MLFRKSLATLAVGCLLSLGLMGCAGGNRMGMVTDPATGLQYGSVIEKSLFVDAQQFRNRTMKVTTRNTSGDAAFDLRGFESDIQRAYVAKGYEAAEEQFGLKVDVNVLYSGHIRRDMATEYAFLGGAAGGIAGYRSDARAGTAIGVLSGATIGAILGSTMTDDTYIVIAEVAFGVAEQGNTGTGRQVVFGSSPPLQESRDAAYRPFSNVTRTKVAVYAGGRNVSQAQVAVEVKRRLVRIVGDVI